MRYHESEAASSALFILKSRLRQLCCRVWAVKGKSGIGEGLDHGVAALTAAPAHALCRRRYDSHACCHGMAVTYGVIAAFFYGVGYRMADGTGDVPEKSAGISG